MTHYEIYQTMDLENDLNFWQDEIYINKLNN